jgi:hypothetical protein
MSSVKALKFSDGVATEHFTIADGSTPMSRMTP